MSVKAQYVFSTKKTYKKNITHIPGEDRHIIYEINYSSGAFGYSYSDISGITNEGTWILYLPPPSIPSNILANDTVLIKLSLAATINAASGNTDTPYFNIYAASSSISTDAQSGFDQLTEMRTSANKIDSFKPNQSGSYVLPSYINTEDDAVIKNALKHGIFIEYRSAKSSTYKAQHTLNGSLTVDLEYATPSSPPKVNIVAPPYNPLNIPNIAIAEGYQIEWDYIQAAGTPQSGYQVLFKHIPITNESLLEMTPVISSSITNHFITPEQMPQMRGYFGGIVIWVRAYINNNTIGSELLDSGEYGDRILYLYFPRPYELAPSNQAIVLANEPTVLKWKVKYSENNDSEPIAAVSYPSIFDIEFSGNGGESWEVIEHQAQVERNGDIYSYNVPPNTFPAGIIQWRIRAYVGGKTIDVYERGVVTSRVQASTSSVASDGKPRPTISWSSSSQIAYQVRFADYDSGAVYGSAKSYTIPYFYADGNYPVQVRTQASDGKWSSWTEVEYVSISNTPPAGSATLSMQKTRHTIVASWSSMGTFDVYILYRNGIPVYVGEDTSYTDVAAFALCSYYVRAVYGKNYVQSNTVVVEAKPDVDCIYDTQNMQWIPLKYSVQPRSRNYSETSNVIYKYYAGRNSPVAYIDNTEERRLNVSYAFKERPDAERLQTAKGHLVIYKDTKGGRIIGVLEALSWEVTKRFVVSITITQVDYKEAVPYET